PILLGQLEFSKVGAGVKKIKLDCRLDAWLQRPHRARGMRGQDRDAGVGEMLLQTPDRGECDDAVADVVELDDEDPADLIAWEYRSAGHQQPGRLVIDRKVVSVF